METPEFYVIKAGQVNKILKSNYNKIYELIKKTYMLHDAKETICPSSFFLKYPANPNTRIIALPAHIKGEVNKSGIKWIGSNPANHQKNLARASAVYILNDGETKYPLACIESTNISMIRTAYSAVLAAEYIHGKCEVGTIGVVGLGPIGKGIIKSFMHLNWKIDKVLCHDLNTKNQMEFLSEMKNTKSSIKFSSSKDLSSLIKKSNIIIFATTSLTPYVSTRYLLDDKKTVLHISLRDIAPELLTECNNIVDDVSHVLTANTSVDLAYSSNKSDAFITGTLAELINNQIQLDKEKTTVFSPMGLGVLDLMLANYVYEMAVAEGEALHVSNFFNSNSNNTYFYE